jgi:aminoglycoside 6'-N-acetyltransferase
MAAGDLQGELVRLRPLRPDDEPAIVAILTAPANAEWWPGYDAERVRREYFTAPDDDLTAYAVERGGVVVGLIQSYEEADPDYRHAGIDVTLAPTATDRGLGTDAVRTLARHLLQHEGHHRLVIDPAAANARAIRCYEKVGFRPVGIMRQYETDGRGGWRDGLLMDLLRSEVT